MTRLLFIKDWIRLGRAAQYDGVKLAQKCLVSPSQLRRFFQAKFYRPPQEWLNELRIWDAMRLLSEQCPVKEVAFRLGFGSVPHFCHRFKEYHGCTPTECFCRIAYEETESEKDPDERAPQRDSPWISAEQRLVSPLIREGQLSETGLN